jgi:hypothetical protein
MLSLRVCASDTGTELPACHEEGPGRTSGEAPSGPGQLRRSLRQVPPPRQEKTPELRVQAPGGNIGYTELPEDAPIGLL